MGSILILFVIAVLVSIYVLSQIHIFMVLISSLRDSRRILSHAHRNRIFWSLLFAPTLVLLGGMLTLAEWKGDTGEWGWFYMINTCQAGLITVIPWLIAFASLRWTLLHARERLYESWINLVMLLTMAAICLWRACAIMIIGCDWPEDAHAFLYFLAVIWVFLPLAPGVNLVLLSVHVCTRRKLSSRIPVSAAFTLAWLGGLAATVYAKIILAHEAYDALPDTAPSCFIVTTAAQGNRRFVGSKPNPITGRMENAQLARMRFFERYLMAEFPAAHRLLRKVYNRVGPAVARRIRRPLVADIAYVILKPLELLAVVICGRTALKGKARQ
jgi:hypothetical protein